MNDLQDRLGSVLRNKLLKSKECPKLVEIPSGKAFEILQEIHSMASKAKDSASLQICSLASLFIVRIFHSSNANQMEMEQLKPKKKGQMESKEESCSVSSVYATTLQDFMTKNKTHIKPGFFFELFNRYPKYSWDLLPHLVEFVSKKANPKAYNLVQGYNMMSRIIKQSNLKQDEFKTKNHLSC